MTETTLTSTNMGADRVADELRRRIPDLDPCMLPALMALVESYHQAWFGQPLHAPDGTAGLGERELNTIGFVASRYQPPSREVVADPGQLEDFLTTARSRNP